MNAKTKKARRRFITMSIPAGGHNETTLYFVYDREAMRSVDGPFDHSHAVAVARKREADRKGGDR